MIYRIKFRDCDETLDALLLKSNQPDGTPKVDIVLTGNTAYFCNPGGYSALEAMGKINFMQASEEVRLSGDRVVSNGTEIGYVLSEAALHMACETALAHREFFNRMQMLAPVLESLMILAKKHPKRTRYNSRYYSRAAWRERNRKYEGCAG